jgi:hypothetical protein
LKNYVFFSKDEAVLRDVEQQYIDMGRDVKREADRVTVYARPRQKPKKKKEEKSKEESTRARDREQRPKERR